MSKDREIDELFKSFNPKVNAGHIMTKISDKMDVIDMVRPEQDRMNSFHKTVSICCFFAGLLIGGVLLSIVLFHSFGGNVIPNILFLTKRSSEFAMFCINHRDILLTFIAAICFILGSLPLIYSNDWGKNL